MILSEAVNDIYLAYRGKLSNVPAAGTEKYNRILTIINRNQRQWAKDSTVDWPSRFEVRQLGTTATGTQVYDIDDDIIRPSDYVQLVDANNNKRTIQILKPQTVALATEGCYVSGTDPLQLTFVTTIGDSLSGLTIQMPCYTMPDDYTSPNDTIIIDNPQWLIYATAAELARNDYSKEEQYSNLQGIANDLYANMKSDAEVNAYSQPNGVPNNLPQYQSLEF